MEPVIGLPGGMEFIIICCATLPALLLVAIVLFIVRKGATSSRQETSRPSTSPADWYVDPTARHELRYWNGLEWTHSVSDGGVQSDDPL